ncbi:MAG TPA: DoxX family membrane protein [Candidatus Dormibacteraeota bacterium]
MQLHLRRVPERLATGAFILHAGWGKWHGTEQQATTLHTTASNAFPPLKAIAPKRFLRLLAAGELATGTALLMPLLPDSVAGAVLTAFSGTLLTMYWRSPAMRKPGSIWPTPAGTAVSKDVWMLGIGAGMLTRP